MSDRVPRVETISNQIRLCTFMCTYYNESPVCDVHDVRSKASDGSQKVDEAKAEAFDPRDFIEPVSNLRYLVADES